jgi:2-haloacid dehalogenase
MTLRVAVFDVLGTVLDERRGFREAVAALDPPVDDPIRLADRWLDGVSARTAEVASGAAEWHSWEERIDRALADAAPDVHEEHGHELRGVGRRLPAWADSAAGIRALSASHRVVALSNAGVLPLVESSRAAGITWDAVFSAEMVDSAKPDPRVYRFLLDQLGLDPADVVMVAAHPWDLRAAAEQGMRTAHVTRPGEGAADAGEAFDRTVGDLVGLAAVLGR